MMKNFSKKVPRRRSPRRKLRGFLSKAAKNQIDNPIATVDDDDNDSVIVTGIWWSNATIKSAHQFLKQYHPEKYNEIKTNDHQVVVASNQLNGM